MNDAHEPSHGQPRRPLRLQPLPRPGRPVEPEPDGARDAEADEQPAPAAEPTPAAWIHEWSQPATTTDA